MAWSMCGWCGQSKMNALDGAMFAALVKAEERLKNEPSVRAAVLSREGRAFCAGLDKASLEAPAAGSNGLGAQIETADRTPRWRQPPATGCDGLAGGSGTSDCGGPGRRVRRRFPTGPGL